MRKLITSALIESALSARRNLSEPDKPLVGTSQLQKDSDEGTRGQLAALNKSLYTAIAQFINDPEADAAHNQKRMATFLVKPVSFWKLVRSTFEEVTDGEVTYKHWRLGASVLGHGRGYESLINVAIEKRAPALRDALAKVIDDENNTYLGARMAEAVGMPFSVDDVGTAEAGEGDEGDEGDEDPEQRLADARLRRAREIIDTILKPLDDATRVLPAAPARAAGAAADARGRRPAAERTETPHERGGEEQGPERTTPTTPPRAHDILRPGTLELLPAVGKHSLDTFLDAVSKNATPLATAAADGDGDGGDDGDDDSPLPPAKVRKLCRPGGPIARIFHSAMDAAQANATARGHEPLGPNALSLLNIMSTATGGQTKAIATALLETEKAKARQPAAAAGGPA